MKTIIPIGPYHPLQEEPELFKLEVEGEKVVGLEINLGYNHRGHEWLAEKKTYDQVPFLVERICGICSNSHPLAGVQAIEVNSLSARAASITFDFAGPFDRLQAELDRNGFALEDRNGTFVLRSR